MNARRIARPEAPPRRCPPKNSGTFVRAPPSADEPEWYDPELDVVPPISMRASCMELLWICGDCGEHYPRAQQVPDQCRSCGAPKQNFYVHVED